MNLRDLKYLVTLADTGHFSRAAEICNVSQPTLSMQLRKLEDFLGVSLLERTQRQAVLTPAGREIVARARGMLSEADAIVELARHHRNPFAGELSIGLFPTLAAYLLPVALPLINAEFPKLDLMLIEEKTPTLTDMLSHATLDCAMLALPLEGTREGAPHPQFETAALFHEPFYLAVPKDHRLSARKHVTTADLRRENMLLLDEGHCLREQALDVCRAIGIGESKHFRATSLETLRHMVAAKRGVTLMPALTVHDDTLLAYIPFENPAPERVVGLVWRKGSPRQALFTAMAEHLRASLPKASGGIINAAF